MRVRSSSQTTLPGSAPLLLLGLFCTIGGCTDLLGTGDGPSSALESVTPGRGAREVSVLSSMTLRFLEPMDPYSVEEGVRLLDGNRSIGVNIATTDPSGAETRSFDLSPRDPLDFGTRYTVAVSSDVRNAAGEPLERKESWHFRTEGKTPPSPSVDRMAHHVRVLAHDSMRGRGSGTGDERKAALYIASQFDKYELTSPPTGFIQDFSTVSPRSGQPLASQNVMGWVAGSGELADDWIVVGAHYDHIGFRNLPDESQGPNNGADDNASGTAAVMELARNYRSWTGSGGTAERDRRSVLFIAFGAEEEGLLGSCFYTDSDPVIPLGSTGAMMNLDMVGRVRDEYVRLSVNEGAPIWQDLAEDANAPLLDLDVTPTATLRGTDYVCFGRHGIPFISFYTGTHPEYHTPADDVGLLNLKGMRRVGDVAMRILSRLVVMPEPPSFGPGQLLSGSPTLP